MNLRVLCAWLLPLLLTAGCPPAAANDSCTGASADCVAVGDWSLSLSLGAGVRTNPIYGKGDIPLVVVPQISYYGKRFFLENLELGFTLHETDANSFALIATPGYDRVFFFRRDLQNIFIGGGLNAGPVGPVANPHPPDIEQEFPVRERHTTVLVGPEWTFHYGRFVGQIDGLREVTGRHEGYEVRAAVAAPLFTRGKNVFSASAGLTWKSDELVDYYYGIDNLYRPGSALSPFAKVRYSRQLNDRFAINALAHYEYLGSAVADSPIVSNGHVATVFAGVVFNVF